MDERAEARSDLADLDRTAARGVYLQVLNNRRTWFRGVMNDFVERGGRWLALSTIAALLGGPTSGCASTRVRRDAWQTPWPADMEPRTPPGAPSPPEPDGGPLVLPRPDDVVAMAIYPASAPSAGALEDDEIRYDVTDPATLRVLLDGIERNTPLDCSNLDAENWAFVYMRLADRRVLRCALFSQARFIARAGDRYTSYFVAARAQQLFRSFCRAPAEPAKK